jgi:hypothetical protein
MNQAEHLIKIQEAARRLPNLLETGKKEQAVIFLASTIIAAEKLLTDLLDPSAANDTDPC